MAAAGQTVEIYRVDEIIKVHNTLIFRTVKSVRGKGSKTVIVL